MGLDILCVICHFYVRCSCWHNVHSLCSLAPRNSLKYFIGHLQHDTQYRSWSLDGVLCYQLVANGMERCWMPRTTCEYTEAITNDHETSIDNTQCRPGHVTCPGLPAPRCGLDSWCAVLMRALHGFPLSAKGTPMIVSVDPLAIYYTTKPSCLSDIFRIFWLLCNESSMLWCEASYKIPKKLKTSISNAPYINYKYFRSTPKAPILTARKSREEVCATGCISRTWPSHDRTL